MSAWFWNIAGDQQQFFAEQLEQGVLRQGWGYSQELDLEMIKKKLGAEVPLDRAERVTWDRCYHMLERIEEGDIVVVKNVPEWQHFSLVRVSGPYSFEIPAIGDFGHMLPVEAIRSYNKNSALVPGRFTAALDREQNPIRVTYKHATTVRDLARLEAPEDAGLQPEDFREKLDRWKESLLKPLRRLLAEDLTHKDAERLVLNLLQMEGLDTTYTAGPNERGADVRSEVGLAGTLTSMSASLAIQVKMKWGTDNETTGVKQLVRAIEEHQVDAGLLVTFADQLGPDLEAALDEARKEYRIDALHGAELYQALLRFLVESDRDDLVS